MRLPAALFALVLLWPAAAPAQDWCNASPLSRTEQAICNDPILGDLDAELNRVYLASDRDRAAQDRWLAQRDRCGSDIFCIEDLYRDRIDRLRDRPAPRADLRPWCGSSRLNRTERTICATETLADLDAALQAVYGATRARSDDPSQIAWLRERRDGCGDDVACIGNAYLRRIMELGGRLRAAGG